MAETCGIQTLVTTDSSGVFAVRDVPAGVNTLTVLMLGYHPRTDTIITPERALVRLSIPLDISPLDGPCSGFASVQVRRWVWPWTRRDTVPF